VKGLTSTTNVWNEHAHIPPDGKKIVWISSQGYPFTPAANWQSTLKTDLWMMNADGSGKQQVTFFNTPGNPQYTGARVILSDGSWNPAGDKYVMQMDSIDNRGDTSQVILLSFAAPQ
jgi:Tol biopolymer transport system component